MFQNEQRITITARDLKVVSALQCDGRMTMQALADKIGIPSTRLRKATAGLLNPAS